MISSSITFIVQVHTYDVPATYVRPVRERNNNPQFSFRSAACTGYL